MLVEYVIIFTTKEEINKYFVGIIMYHCRHCVWLHIVLFMHSPEQNAHRQIGLTTGILRHYLRTHMWCLRSHHIGHWRYGIKMHVVMPTLWRCYSHMSSHCDRIECVTLNTQCARDDLFICVGSHSADVLLMEYRTGLLFLITRTYSATMG